MSLPQRTERLDATFQSQNKSKTQTTRSLTHPFPSQSDRQLYGVLHSTDSSIEIIHLLFGRTTRQSVCLFWSPSHLLAQLNLTRLPRTWQALSPRKIQMSAASFHFLSQPRGPLFSLPLLSRLPFKTLCIERVRPPGLVNRPSAHLLLVTLSQLDRTRVRQRTLSGLLNHGYVNSTCSRRTRKSDIARRGSGSIPSA